MAQVKIGVSVFLNEDGSYGIQSTSQSPLTVVGLLMKGIQIAQGSLEVKEPSPILVPN